MNASKLLLLLLVTTATVHAQNASDRPAETDSALGPGEIAIVNGERIPESVFRLFALGVLQVNVDELTPEGREEVVERLIFMTLLANEAERNGLHLERRIAAELEVQRLQVLARHMSNRFTEENPPQEAELTVLYEANLPRLQAPRYKTSHILVATKREAEDLIDELDDKADFRELAREHSTESTAPGGGDLGWITADSVVEPFAEAIQSAKAGTHIRTPIQTEYGWHVIMVEEIEDQPAPNLEDIRDDLIAAAQTQKLSNFAASLREAAEVTLVE